MEEYAGADVVRFSGFRFDRSHGCLLRQDKDGTFTPVAVGSRALDLLGLLIDRHGDLVSKDEILNAVWPGGRGSSRAPMSRCKSRRFAGSSMRAGPTAA
jgi:DNA-binding winged helix-turn-helix (wHTH) protein